MPAGAYDVLFDSLDLAAVFTVIFLMTPACPISMTPQKSCHAISSLVSSYCLTILILL